MAESESRAYHGDVENHEPNPRQGRRRRLPVERFGLLLASLVLLGAEGCLVDAVHTLFFGVEAPRYGGEREEEERLNYPYRYLPSPSPSPEGDEFPPVSLPTFTAQPTPVPEAESILRDLYPERYASPAPSPAPRRGRTIQAIRHGGKYIAETELKPPTTGPECGEQPHWHAKSGGLAKATDGTTLADPGGCGFGTVKENPLRPIEIAAD